MVAHQYEGAGAFAHSCKGVCSLVLFYADSQCRSPPPSLKFRFSNFKNTEDIRMYYDLTARRAPQEIRMDFAVLPAASLYFLYWRTAKWLGFSASNASNIRSTGFLNSSSSSRTSIALMNSMRVEKFCSSTGAS